MENHYTRPPGLKDLGKTVRKPKSFIEDYLKAKTPIEVQLEFFEKEDTELNRELDRIYGRENLSLFYHVEKTYLKYMVKHFTENIVILTDKLESQVYKFGPFEVSIKNLKNK
jgi:hypothetical protein